VTVHEAIYRSDVKIRWCDRRQAKNFQPAWAMVARRCTLRFRAKGPEADANKRIANDRGQSFYNVGSTYEVRVPKAPEADARMRYCQNMLD